MKKRKNEEKKDVEERLMELDEKVGIALDKLIKYAYENNLVDQIKGLRLIISPLGNKKDLNISKINKKSKKNVL